MYKGILYAHRGNIDGKIVVKENTSEHIDAALKSGFHVEVDIRYENKRLYYGHDFCQEIVTIDSFLKHSRILVHCKDIASLQYVQKNIPEAHYFFHENDRATITSQQKIILHPLTLELNSKHPITFPILPDLQNTILVWDDYTNGSIKSANRDILDKFYGIITDYPRGLV